MGAWSEKRDHLVATRPPPSATIASMPRLHLYPTAPPSPPGNRQMRLTAPIDPKHPYCIDKSPPIQASPCQKTSLYASQMAALWQANGRRMALRKPYMPPQSRCRTAASEIGNSKIDLLLEKKDIPLQWNIPIPAPLPSQIPLSFWGSNLRWGFPRPC